MVHYIMTVTTVIIDTKLPSSFDLSLPLGSIEASDVPEGKQRSQYDFGV